MWGINRPDGIQLMDAPVSTETCMTGPGLGHHMYTAQGTAAKNANKGPKGEFHAAVAAIYSVMFRLVLNH